MPPALSDQEDSSAGEEQVPPQKKGKQAKAQPVVDEEDAASGSGSDSEGAADEYVVEKILGHRFAKGEIVFHVKWQGYDDPVDETWEPEHNMGGAVDVMAEYFEQIGGRPQPKGQKRKGQQSVAAQSKSETPTSTAKRPRTEKQWSPPPGSWEHDVSHVDTVEETRDPKSGNLTKYAYLVWNNQKKTQHPLRHVYQKCPQKMLLYYESHLVFTNNDDLLNGDEVDGNNVMMKDVY